MFLLELKQAANEHTPLPDTITMVSTPLPFSPIHAVMQLLWTADVTLSFVLPSFKSTLASTTGYPCCYLAGVLATSPPSS